MKEKSEWRDLMQQWVKDLTLEQFTKAYDHVSTWLAKRSSKAEVCWRVPPATAPVSEF